MKIILASASPRRQELLNQVGCSFEVAVSEIMEDNTLAMPPAQLATSQATAKALDVASRLSPENIVIGADTIVVLGDQVFGKPADAGEARRMLHALAGREHHVITGVAVVHGATVKSDFAVTEVVMRRYTEDEIARYIATGEPMDKAGAYAIQGQGALLVESIAGCYSNVVGLPLTTLNKLLQYVGVTLL